MALGTAIGAITFTGSIIAFAQAAGPRSPASRWSSPASIRSTRCSASCWSRVIVWFVVGAVGIAASGASSLLSLALGFLLILPIGGADMPVVISMLNSYSGWAACGIGFTLANSLLIITGALVGSSGAILSYIMCKGMNRSIFNVILGGFGTEGGAVAAARHGDNGRSSRAAPRTPPSS